MARRASTLIVLSAVLGGSAWGFQRLPAGTAEGPATLAKLVRGAERWVVALRVEREGEPAQPPRRRAVSPREELRDYRVPPAGYVTGILVDPEGHVLTSRYNVAGQVRSIRLRLPGGGEHKARILAVDPVDDLALLESDGGPVVDPAAWEDPPWAEGPVEAGRIVLALGRSPDPRRITATEGIVSAVARNGYRAFQTDAKLNYGNSGGPLIDLDGRFVGVACFVHPPERAAESDASAQRRQWWGLNSGVGFATRASTVREVLPVMRRGETVARPLVPFLGVGPDTGRLHLRGAAVEVVQSGSGAERAGLHPGDVIVELDGTAVTSFQHLRNLVYTRQSGDTVRLKARRGAATVEVEAVLGRRGGE